MIDQPFPQAATGDALQAVKLPWRTGPNSRSSPKTLGSSLVNLEIQKAASSPVLSLTGSLASARIGPQEPAPKTFRSAPAWRCRRCTTVVWRRPRSSRRRHSGQHTRFNKIRPEKPSPPRSKTTFLPSKTLKTVSTWPKPMWRRHRGNTTWRRPNSRLGLETTPDVLTAFAALITRPGWPGNGQEHRGSGDLQLNYDLGL